jgi:hypothetical protein
MMPKALRSVTARRAAMSRRRIPGVVSDAEQDPGVIGQEGPAATFTGYQIPENVC